MGKITIQQDQLTDKEKLKLRVMQLKSEMRKMRITDPWTFFKLYHPEYPVNKFRSCINTQQADQDFTDKLESMVEKLKKG